MSCSHFALADLQLLDALLQLAGHFAQLLHGAHILQKYPILVHHQELVQLCSVGHLVRRLLLEHRIWQHLAHLLRHHPGGRVPARHFAVLIGEPHDPNPLDILQLLPRAQLSQLALDSAIARLQDVAGHLQVPIHHQTLVRLVRVQPDLAVMEDAVRRDSSLPAQLKVVLELARIGGAHNDLFTPMGHDRIVTGMCVGVEGHDQAEVTLLRIGAALLAHIIACRLREVQASNRRLADLAAMQVNSVKGRMNMFILFKEN